MSMIEGYVNEALEPVVEIGLKRGDVVTIIPAAVDTGFSGYLCLAKRWIDQLEMTFEYAESYELADGEVITMDVFRGMIRFDGQERAVNVILTASDDTLIGASLFKECRVAIDYPRRHVAWNEGRQVRSPRNWQIEVPHCSPDLEHWWPRSIMVQPGWSREDPSLLPRPGS